MCLMHLVNKIRSLFMAKPTDFLLNTDYEMDKIVFFKEGEFIGEEVFPNTLGFAPLLFGVWSTDKDFSTSNTIGVQPYGAYGSANPVFVTAMVSGHIGEPISNSAIGIGANQGTYEGKIYYRLYGFAPPDYKGSTPKTASHSKQFILNTDYNYRKLKASGTFSQANEEYVHNLGYIPHIMAWEENSTESDWWITPAVFFAPNKFGIEITDTKIKLILESSSFFDKIHWRLYYDES